MNRLALVTFLVRDYDEAIEWFRHCLDAEVVEDTVLSPEKRWVRVSFASGSELLLARASTSVQASTIGRQAGGRVAFFLETDEFDAQYERMRDRGVKFEEAPRREPYGTVAVFQDFYGNRWDLIQPTAREEQS